MTRGPLSRLIPQPRPDPRRASRERGATVFEFAGLVPFILLAAVLVWQVILVILTSMYASHATSEGARQASVTPNDHGKIKQEAKKRVSPPWDSDDAFTLKLIKRDCDPTGRYCKLYVRSTIKTPAVLPGMHTPWKIGSESRVIVEEGVE